MQLGLAGAIAAQGIDVHARLDHVGAEDGGVGLVGRNGSDDVHALDGQGGAIKTEDAQGRRGGGQVGLQLAGGVRVHVVHVQRVDAQHVVESQRLEFGLRAVADQGHRTRVGPRQRPRGQGRCDGSAQGGGQRQFADQQRFARVDLRQGAKGHHGG
ncbi:hypothetical protein D3C71_1411370 [compost metagenome]